jgi:C-terminal processing protease CtpA/Prc
VVNLRAVALSIVLFFASSAFALKTKPEQIIAMEAILAELDTQYGMAKFKRETFGVDTVTLRQKYTALIQSARTLEEEAGLEKVKAREILTADQFRQLMIGMVAELRDGHVNVNRLSDEGATLGLVAASIGEKLIVTLVRQDLMVGESSMEAIQPGDEILSVDGVPVVEIAKRNMLYAQGGTFSDRWDTAMNTVVNRFHSIQELPKEGASVDVTFSRSGYEFKARLRWVYNSDFRLLLSRFPRYLRSPVSNASSQEVPVPYGFRGTVRSYFRTGILNNPNLNASLLDVGEAVNREIEKSGTQGPLSDLSEVTRLQAYMVRYQNKNVGVLRLPSYSPGDGMEAIRDEYFWIAEVLRRFESLVDVLVIDQVSNTGGSVYYTLRLLGLFASMDKPMQTVRADYKLSETLLANWKPGFYHDLLYRTPPSHADLKIYDQYYKELRAKFDRGEEWTGLMAGFDMRPPEMGNEPGLVFPGKEGVFTKPVLILNDRMSGSGGDFFPAQMQYNKRALVMGETSCGLGGPVYRSIGSMPGSEMSFRCTSGYTELPDGWPIENIGVVPDLYRAVEVADVYQGFTAYSGEVLSQAVAMVSKKKASKGSLHEWELSSQLQDSILSVAEKMQSKTGKPYIASLNKLSDLMAKADAEELEGIIVPLPSVLLKDRILLTLWQRLEVKERLEDLLKLPQWQAHKDLIESLIVFAELAPASISFADPCELRLRMTSR